MHAVETLERQKHHLNNNDPEFLGFVSNTKPKIQRTENKQQKMQNTQTEKPYHSQALGNQT